MQESVSTLWEKRASLFENLTSDIEAWGEKLDRTSTKLSNIRSTIEGYKNIVVLTTKEITDSSVYCYSKNGILNIDGFSCQFTTCRRFKGLEAEVIILIDIDSNVLLDQSNRLLFYVGASRAKFELGLIMNLLDDEIKIFIKQYNPTIPEFLHNSNGLNFYFGAQKI